MVSRLSPIDVLDALVQMDEARKNLTIARRGLMCLAKNYSTSSTGLLPTARAAYSAAQAMVECSALLSYMVGQGGGASPDPVMPLSKICTTSSNASGEQGFERCTTEGCALCDWAPDLTGICELAATRAAHAE